MVEQLTKIYLDPQNQMDEVLIKSVRAYGAKRMGKAIGISHSWLCRILRGLGGIPGHKFKEMMDALQAEAVHQRYKDLTIKDGTPPEQDDN